MLEQNGIVYFTEYERRKYAQLSIRSLEMLIRSHVFKSFIVRAGEIIGAER